MNNANPESGLILWIIIIIVALLALSYFGFSLRDLGEDETTQDNFSYVTEWLRFVWENYLREPAVWIWENIVSFIWNDLFLENLQRLQNGEDFSDLAPDTPTTE